VAVLDVPGAFMQADIDELVHVCFTGKMIDLLIDIDPEMYKPCVTYKGQEKVMYVEQLKALYGTLQAARLFWEKLSKKLVEWGFTINPYDTCVANKIVNGKQLTIVWHVDDIKVSHVNIKVVDELICQMEEESGKETPFNKVRGKVHNYLGMQLDFRTPGCVKLSMIDYINVVLQDAPDWMKGYANTPAALHLFQTSQNPDYLEKEDAQVYVHLEMQLLFLSQHARPDIRTAVAFLCTRLRKPDQDDFKKLSRVIRYLCGMLDMPLTLSGDASGKIQWWVDASYAVHPDMKGHTGGTMSLGSGSVYSISIKQKMVSWSSTESEVIGVYDVMPKMMRSTYFLKAQGLNVTSNSYCSLSRQQEIYIVGEAWSSIEFKAYLAYEYQIFLYHQPCDKW
jgi:hypothetical protein